MLLVSVSTQSQGNVVKTFFLAATKENWRPSQKICVAASLETLHEAPTARVLQKSATNRLFGNYSAKSLEPPLHADTTYRSAVMCIRDQITGIANQFLKWKKLGFFCS